MSGLYFFGLLMMSCQQSSFVLKNAEINLILLDIPEFHKIECFINLI